MKTNRFKTVAMFLCVPLVAGILCGSPQRAEATVLAEYLFQSGNGASTDTAVGEGASAFASSGFTAGFGVGPFTGATASIFAPANGIGAAFNASQYFTFTVTPDAGNRLNLSGTGALTFDYSRNTSMSAFNWAIQSSVDGFTSFIDTGSTPTADTLFSRSVNLSTAFDFQDSAVEFRFFVWDGGDTLSSSHGYFDNVILNGTVVPVPEPVNVALGVFGLCLAGVGLGRRFYLRSRA